MEGGKIEMATSTFERKIEISNVEDVKRLIQVISSDAPKKPLSTNPYGSEERKRSESLLKQCLSRSNH